MSFEFFTTPDLLQSVMKFLEPIQIMECARLNKCFNSISYNKHLYPSLFVLCIQDPIEHEGEEALFCWDKKMYFHFNWPIRGSKRFDFIRKQVTRQTHLFKKMGLRQKSKILHESLYDIKNKESCLL